MLTTCKHAYDQLQAENNLLKSKGYAAESDYREYFWGNYARRRADLQLNSFVWQAWTSQVLLWIVVAVCLSGIIFSGFQLWRATTAPASSTESGGATNDPLATNIELSWQNVKVTSSVIGLVVLVISVVYLYLFLKEVYHINVATGLEAYSNSTKASVPAVKEAPQTETE